MSQLRAYLASARRLAVSVDRQDLADAIGPILVATRVGER